MACTTHPVTSLLQSNQTPTQQAESLPVLREEFEEAVHSLKARNSLGVDTITRHTFTKERQPRAMPELSHYQPNQPSQQDHAPSYSQATHGQG